MSDGRPDEGPEAERRLRETGGWPEGVKPGTGRAGETDRALEEGAPEADPATRSPIPGFTEAPDATEVAVEGDATAMARDATEDLPRQG